MLSAIFVNMVNVHWDISALCEEVKCITSNGSSIVSGSRSSSSSTINHTCCWCSYCLVDVIAVAVLVKVVVLIHFRHDLSISILPFSASGKLLKRQILFTETGYFVCIDNIMENDVRRYFTRKSILLETWVTIHGWIHYSWI